MSSHQPPAHLQDAGGVDPTHPRQNFICGLGIHADSEEGAQTNARVQVAAQVQSELESVIEDVLVILDRNGIVTEREDYLSRSSQYTRFEHNELIRITETFYWKGAPGGAKHRAYACLDRREAGEVMRDESRPLVNDMIDAQERALAASKAGDLALFSTQVQRVLKLETELADRYGPLRAVSATSAADAKAALNSVGEVRKEAARLRSKLLISIAVSSVEATHRNKVQQAFRRAFDALEIDASSSASRCRSGGGVTHVLNVSADPEVWKDMMGIYHCTLKFQVTLTDCTSGHSVDGLVEPSTFTSSWTQAHLAAKKQGIQQAWGTLSSDPLVDPLRSAIMGAVPLN